MCYLSAKDGCDNSSLEHIMGMHGGGKKGGARERRSQLIFDSCRQFLGCIFILQKFSAGPENFLQIKCHKNRKFRMLAFKYILSCIGMYSSFYGREEGKS